MSVTASGSGSEADEVAAEQGYVDAMYARLDELRAKVADQLARTRRAGPSGTPQNRSERDAFATEYERRLVQLWAVEDRVAFGRLDLRGGGLLHIGRIGLSDEEQRQILVDWRAEAAQDFYRATAATPNDVVRRRHIGMRGRHVVGVEDELLDVTSASAAAVEGELVLTGEGALMAALAEHRTGHMRDIVSTIQAEQDRIIRSPIEGVLVVQGGPGTGKTAVALHRAAFLLYHHRDRLARTGVLVVGPSSVFLRYIEQVLPSLGESAAVLATPAQLYPGVHATGAEPDEVAAIKGDVRMAQVVARAVAARQKVPRRSVRLDVDGTTVTLRPATVAAARDRARGRRRPHNVAREAFVTAVLNDLVRQLARELNLELDDYQRSELLADLHDSPDVRREVNLCWMPITPERLLRSLFADPDALSQAAPQLSATERALLLREPDAPWTSADVPLLDEAAELLGEDPSARRLEERRVAAEREADVRYAGAVLESMGGAGGLVNAELLADRFVSGGSEQSVAERAADDRTWTYGHVVVDEAQELSAMAWRLLMRRCPSRSMTVVGDTAQTAALAGASGWAEALDLQVPGRWRLEELTVNYRTPAEIMAVAAQVLVAAGVEARAPLAARHGQPPVFVEVPTVDVDALAHVVVTELEVLGAGRLAVVVPRRGYDTFRSDLHDRVGARRPPRAGSLDDQVVVLDVGEVKGLEFDSVVVVEPAEVLDQSGRGAGDLYVALTRSTQRLTVLHSRPLPFAAVAVTTQN
ncbi:MAG: AAA family ATPase [Actinomycetes bacterium]